MIRVFRSLAPMLVLAVAIPAQSQGTAAAVANSTTSGHTVPVPSARAARRSTQVALDGALNDVAWQAATPVTEFLQIDPTEGQPATQRTEVRFLYDEGALYIGAKMYDTQGHAGVRAEQVEAAQEDAPQDEGAEDAGKHGGELGGRAISRQP